MGNYLKHSEKAFKCYTLSKRFEHLRSEEKSESFAHFRPIGRNLYSANSSVTNCASNVGQCPLANMAIIKTSAGVSWLNTAAESSQFGAMHGRCQWNSASSGKIESRSILHQIHWLLLLACAVSGSGNGTLELSAAQLRRANEFAIFPLSTKWTLANLIGEMRAHFFWIELNW